MNKLTPKEFLIRVGVGVGVLAIIGSTILSVKEVIADDIKCEKAEGVVIKQRFTANICIKKEMVIKL